MAHNGNAPLCGTAHEEIALYAGHSVSMYFQLLVRSKSLFVCMWCIMCVCARFLMCTLVFAHRPFSSLSFLSWRLCHPFLFSFQLEEVAFHWTMAGTCGAFRTPPLGTLDPTLPLL